MGKRTGILDYWRKDGTVVSMHNLSRACIIPIYPNSEDCQPFSPLLSEPTRPFHCAQHNGPTATLASPAKLANFLSLLSWQCCSQGVAPAGRSVGDAGFVGPLITSLMRGPYGNTSPPSITGVPRPPGFVARTADRSAVFHGNRWEPA